MKAALLRIEGPWAHFKRPETNNNPLTHDFITKTALIGMIGAVTGKERAEMTALFPQLSEDLLYGVALERAVKKQSWAFTLRRFSSDIKNRLEAPGLSPRPFEFLKEPKFRVVLALQNSRSEALFSAFVDLVRNGEVHYDPVLGLHNCPAELTFIDEGTAEAGSGAFETEGFLPDTVRRRITPGGPFRIGFDRIPAYQNGDMWNPPDRYVEVIYRDFLPGVSQRLGGEGDHLRIRWSHESEGRGEEGRENKGKEEAWCLI